jgi:hypothetical protein
VPRPGSSPSDSLWAKAYRGGSGANGIEKNGRASGRKRRTVTGGARLSNGVGDGEESHGGKEAGWSRMAARGPGNGIRKIGER